jgi:hypothetical protein
MDELLLLYAAGYHATDSCQNVLAEVVSSYTSTIKPLEYSHRWQAMLSFSESQKVMIYAMPQTFKQKPIEFVEWRG